MKFYSYDDDYLVEKFLDVLVKCNYRCMEWNFMCIYLWVWVDWDDNDDGDDDDDDDDNGDDNDDDGK